MRLDELRERQIQRLGRRTDRLERRSLHFSRTRLVVVVLGAVVVFWMSRAYGPNAAVAAFGVFLVAFLVLIRVHDRTEEGLKRTRLLRRIKELHERRREIDWDALPDASADLDPILHPTAIGLLGGIRGADRPSDRSSSAANFAANSAANSDASSAARSDAASGDRSSGTSTADRTREQLDTVRQAFAVDLNLTGRRSLHQLLDGCASKGGSDALADWITDPAPDFEGVMQRQRLVRQLVPLRLFRDHLARVTMLDGTEASSHWDDRKLRAWLGREEVIPRLKPWLVGLGAFAAINVILIIGHIAGLLPMIWPMTVLIYFAVYFMTYRSVKDLFDESQDLDLMLQRFTPALVYIERFRFAEGSAADRLTQPMVRVRPSEELASIRRIAAAAAVTRSEFLWLLLNVVMPWNMLFTYLMHRAKGSLRAHLPEWLDVWYTLEAASSLASYADYHPLRSFPTLTAPSVAEQPVFDGRGLGHPLLKEDVKVRNDFTVDQLGEVILVTGSNMSGKSTFLRTVGVNLRLGFAGGPVDATSLHTTCFSVFTSINVVDSVQEGLSHFYAEVQRLKLLLDALDDRGSLPLLNLIDEIFRGTNNRERLIGSRAFIRALAGRRAVSLISTHDLELTQLDEVVPQLSNFHFREDVSGDRMTFDYTLREGPSPTTNALKIMQRAGLPVDPEADEPAIRNRGSSNGGIAP